MRNPYVVGGRVQGQYHYGRIRLIDHLLHSPVDAVWVIGNRRMGKTSLLHQLENLTLGDETYIPLFWDMQGCETFADLSDGLVDAVEDVASRFKPLGVDVADLHGQSVHSILRTLRRRACSTGRSALLLCDEAEALISAGRRDSQGLAQLRAIWQRGKGLRVVIASTKRLSQLNDLCRDWPTGSFLSGFGLRNLTGLDPQEAKALICQAQADMPVDVAPELVQKIRQHTSDHPFLIQYLCGRLFLDGRLRPIEPPDLLPDVLLTATFDHHCQMLSDGELAIVREVAARGIVDEPGLQRATGMERSHLRNFVYGLTKLDYLREHEGGWVAGNSFFATWLKDNRDVLAQIPASRISDQATQEMLIESQKQEAAHLRELLGVHKRNLYQLELQRARQGVNVPLPLVREIEHAQAEIKRITEELSKLVAMGT